MRVLAGFFGTAFGLSWLWFWLGLVVLGLPGPVVATVGSFVGPTAAAFACSAAVGGRAEVLRLLRRYVRWRVGVRWYLLALLGWPVVFVAAGAVAGGRLALPEPSAVLGFLGVFGFVLAFGGPLGEEPGWRGFALPRLQRRLGPLPGTLLLGVLHGLWHLPVFLLVPGYNGAPTEPAGLLAAFGQFVLAAMAGAVLFSWLFNRTDGSLLPVILLHTSTNTAGLLVPGFDPEPVRFPVLVAVAVLLVLSTRGRLGCALSPGDLSPR